MAEIEMTQKNARISSSSKPMSNQNCHNKLLLLDVLMKHLLLITTLLGVLIAIFLGLLLVPYSTIYVIIEINN